MPKKKGAIVKVGDPNIVPAFMTKTKITGLEELSQYVIPPRLKIVQKQSGDELLEQYGVGDVIITPDNELVCEMGRTAKGAPTGESSGFDFVALFFFVEYCTWNPIKLRGQLPAIRERTLDPASVIANKSRNSALRKEPCPEDPSVLISHCEHLNFVAYVADFPDPIIISFSRGSWGSGRNLCNLIKNRNAPIYGSRWHAVPVKLENEQGSWWALEVTNAEEPWVDDEDTFTTFQAQHTDFVKVHKSSRLRTSYEEEPTTIDAAAVPAGKSEF